jgi:hypothetical protein
MKKNEKNKKVNLTAVRQVEKLLPEPKPNSEPMLMGIASAAITQNPLLSVFFLQNPFYIP